MFLSGAVREAIWDDPRPVLQSLSLLEQMGFPGKDPSEHVSHTC